MLGNKGLVQFKSKNRTGAQGETCSIPLTAELNWCSVGSAGTWAGSVFQWVIARGKKEYLYVSVVVCIVLYACVCECLGGLFVNVK